METGRKSDGRRMEEGWKKDGRRIEVYRVAIIIIINKK